MTATVYEVWVTTDCVYAGNENHGMTVCNMECARKFYSNMKASVENCENLKSAKLMKWGDKEVETHGDCGICGAEWNIHNAETYHGTECHCATCMRD